MTRSAAARLISNSASPRLGSIVGRSASATRLLEEVARVAPYDANVLVTGPSGTGKELVARQLHAQGPRSGGLFIPVDCALLTGELMATQLFGHVAGAFTSASHAALGCFRAADGGTLFLDEIGEMPLVLQAKLLRAIQERAVAPVGSHVPVAVDVRIIAATNRDLKSETTAGRFREDLFYRLNVVNIRTTPLAERREDVEPLAQFFLEQLTEEGHPHTRLTPGAITSLENFAWPGNVRQLRNILEQAAIETEGDWIGQELVDRLLAQASFCATPVSSTTAPPPDQTQPAVDQPDAEDDWESFAEHERQHLIATLEHTYYNRSAAARLLGITRQSLIRRMEKHGIQAPHLAGKMSKK